MANAETALNESQKFDPSTVLSTARNFGVAEEREVIERIGRGEWIRTTDLLVPNLVRPFLASLLKSIIYKILISRELLEACWGLLNPSDFGCFRKHKIVYSYRNSESGYRKMIELRL